ncbi:MAG TPA: DUF2254 domain-containing protein [Gemmatimonadales bacterium]|nr:DUF2254 domain-containing protein [Gemmatimonadales bacterium]
MAGTTSVPDLPGVWARLRDSLWFVPSLIVLAAVLLAIGMVEVSAFVPSDALERWPRLFGAGAEGARSMLSAIAGSMITVAGVTFSITMVAVTQASTQYTPRILRNFMRDRANQAVLGIFVGIFAYCLVVLRTIRGGDESSFVPSIAVLVGILMALLGIAVLIFFIHHIATTLQASEIIARISRETGEIVDRVFPAELEDTVPAEETAASPSPAGNTWCPVTAGGTGYIQRADVRRLVSLADEHHVVIRLDRTAGDFVIAGQPVAWFARDAAGAGGSEPSRDEADLAEILLRQYAVGAYRTLDHDPAFGIRQLVDIALKALSPGINDTTTAVTCVDYLGAVLTRLANRRIEVLHPGAGGRLRVLAAGPTFEDLIGLATDEIRQHAHGNVGVMVRQLETLGSVAAVSRSAARRRAVARHVELVREVVARTVPASYDRDRLDAAAREALAVAVRS